MDIQKYNELYTEPFGRPENDGKSNVILSKNLSLSLNDAEIRKRTQDMVRVPNANVLAVGSPGSGKTYGIVEPNLLQANSSYVVVDPTGTLCKKYRKYLEKHGYRVQCLNLVNPDNETHYNPLRYIKTEQDIAAFSQKLIQATSPKEPNQDPFWEKSENALLNALLAYLLKTYAPKKHTMKELLNLLDRSATCEGQDTELDKMFKEVEEKEEYAYAVHQYQTFQMGSGRTKLSVAISLSVRLQAFSMNKITDLTDSDNMELDTLGDRKTATFIVASYVSASWNFLATTLLMQILQILHRKHDQKKTSEHMTIILDEMANLNSIPSLGMYVATAWHEGISFMIMLQSITQLKIKYPESWEEIVGNCDNKIYLGNMDLETVNWFGEQVDVYQKRAGNDSTAVKALTTDELRTLDIHSCVIQQSGIGLLIDQKYDVKDHPNWKQI